MKKLERDFYTRDVNSVAQDLIGKILVHESNGNFTSGIIIETEAYNGEDDEASHTFNNKRTPRTEIQFREGGFAYIYLIYGMYYCFNVTANIANKPEAVLIRALEPLEGIELMQQRRKNNKIINLCNGPGKLCIAMDITKLNYGEDLCGSELYILDDNINLKIETSARINTGGAEKYRNLQWRYFAAENKYVSKRKK